MSQGEAMGAFEKNSAFALQKSFKDQVYNIIREAILSGQLKPGDRLREADFAKQMGISRGPIREAFALLAKEGLVKASPHKETVVAELSHQETIEIFVPIRRLIEKYAANHAMKVMTEEDYAHLSSLLDSMKDACERGDVNELTHLDISFHSYIVNRVESTNLSALWDIIIVRIHPQILMRGIGIQEKAKGGAEEPLEPFGSLDKVEEEHREYLSFLKNKDIEAIDRHLYSHIF
ncbi:MAG: GntR family transcriptional regulator [Oscillospiraceae bacterium]